LDKRGGRFVPLPNRIELNLCKRDTSICLIGSINFFTVQNQRACLQVEAEQIWYIGGDVYIFCRTIPPIIGVLEAESVPREQNKTCIVSSLQGHAMDGVDNSKGENKKNKKISKNKK
jgi:hypothetical protein